MKTNALTPESLLERWQAIAADASPSAWEPENAYGFFLQFPGHPAQLRAALKGVPRAEAIAQRLERAFAAARVVRRPPALACNSVELIHARERPPPSEEDTTLYELETDWFRDVCESPFASAMREAAYSLAADYLLAHFVLWPLAGRRSDPYSHYFELWRHGAIVRYGSDGLSVYVTPHGRDA